MTTRARGRTAAVLAALLPAGLLTACTGDTAEGEAAADTPAAEAVASLADAWSRLDPDAFAERTTAPDRARSTLRGLLDDLSVLDAEVLPDGEPTCGEDTCTQPLSVALVLDGVGTWEYTTEATVELDAEGGEVRWDPTLLHPDLTARTALERVRSVPPRASLLDRSGRPLTRQLPVYRVGVVPGEAEPPSYTQIADLLGVDEASLRDRAEAAEPDWFVDVITLREVDYRPVRDALLEVPGVSVDPGRLPLAPTSAWGRAVLGTVAPATAETLEGASDLALDTDYVGAGGLQAAYEEQLAGTPGGAVLLVDAGSGEQLDTLWRQPGEPGAPVETTLSYDVQQAGEQAVAGQPETTVLVAVDASTGEILADVNGPETTSYDTGLIGEFPPGSTFKVVSSAALIGAGQDVGEQVACPSTTVVEGKRFKNDEFSSLAPGATFADAIAASCNTTVVERADRLDDTAMTEAAEQFGVGAEWSLPVPAYAGSVPASTGLVDRAASMIGQGRVLMSPLGMALVAATVASGRARTPALVPGADEETGDEVGALPASTVADLQQIMRLVVTEGTASSLRGLPGGVSAKTGTAEYGDREPLRTHGWMIGYRGDLAFACIVVDGEGGNSDAGPVVRRFLELAPTQW